jgi:hypothetical protein
MRQLAYMPHNPNYPSTTMLADTRLLNMIRQHTNGPRFGYAVYSGFGAYDPATDTRYIPNASQIDVQNKKSTPGRWYRPTNDETPFGVAKRAYGSAQLKVGLMLMNNSTWNSHIKKGKAGWESYKTSGLQFNPQYSATLVHAPSGSGKVQPTVWIPPLTGEEPEQIYKTTPTPGPTPIPPDLDPVPNPTPDPTPTPGPGIPGPQGPQGKQGIPGPMGPAGKDGAAANDASIMAAITKYLLVNPPPAGPMGPMGPPGVPGPPGNASDESIKQAVMAYLAKNPPQGGTPGPVGPMGPPGVPGPPGQTVYAKTIESGSGSKMWTIPLVVALLTT